MAIELTLLPFITPLAFTIVKVDLPEFSRHPMPAAGQTCKPASAGGTPGPPGRAPGRRSSLFSAGMALQIWIGTLEAER